jgi:hypothetical protein
MEYWHQVYVHKISYFLRNVEVSIHLIITAGGLSLDGNRWIKTYPKFLMYHGG